MTKHILVTGGNSGIGLALCKLLIKDHSCYVYLGSRDAGRGTAAMKSILEEVPDKVTTYLASIWFMGTIPILRQHIFGLF
jgi:NAD(P)-dependent dehydrogenase (short-subunit alcohol dehydrogenase family)